MMPYWPPAYDWRRGRYDDDYDDDHPRRRRRSPRRENNEKNNSGDIASLPGATPIKGKGKGVDLPPFDTLAQLIDALTNGTVSEAFSSYGIITLSILFKICGTTLLLHQPPPTVTVDASESSFMRWGSASVERVPSLCKLCCAMYRALKSGMLRLPGGIGHEDMLLTLAITAVRFNYEELRATGLCYRFHYSFQSDPITASTYLLLEPAGNGRSALWPEELDLDARSRILLTFNLPAGNNPRSRVGVLIEDGLATAGRWNTIGAALLAPSSFSTNRHFEEFLRVFVGCASQILRNSPIQIAPLTTTSGAIGLAAAQITAILPIRAGNTNP